MVVAALAKNGLPEESLHPGFIGNTIAALFPVVMADGSMPHKPSDAPALEQSLAMAVAAIRREIVALQKPGAAVKAAIDLAALVSAEGYRAFMQFLGPQPLDVSISSCTPQI